MKFLYLFLSFLAVTTAARILAVFPVPLASRFSYNEAIVKSLHAAGHHITLICPFPAAHKLENYTVVDSRFESIIRIGKTTLQRMISLSDTTVLNASVSIEEPSCANILRLKEIQEAFNSTEKRYDVMFIELLAMYECYLPIAERLGIPVIGTVSQRTWKLSDAAVGFPNHPAAIPLELIDAKPSMTFSQRLKNLWLHFKTDYFINYVVRTKVDQFRRKYFPDLNGHSRKKVSLVFYNNHPSLLSRPTPPNAIEIGGIHVKPARPLEKDLERFINEAKNGVILFTFGSMVNTSSLPVEITYAFAKAFAAIPQRVIWKFDDTIDNITDNVLLSKWVPQHDILSHKNVKVFITHCGLSGVYEAIYSGTPVVTTPLGLDQRTTAAILEHLEVGIRLDVKTITAEKVINVLNRIVNDTSYYTRMQRLSRIIKDRPMTPQESVVYWTEYVIRHNGASHLKSAGSEMPLHQYLLLDVVFFIAVILVTLTFVLIYILKIMLSCWKSGTRLILTEDNKKVN